MLMRGQDLELYVARKSGRGQSLSWKVRAMLSTLLLLFISLVLSFSIVLIESMAQGLDDVLQLLGGGSVIAYDRPQDGLLSPEDHLSRVQTTSALASSATGSALVTLRGVDDDYFFPRRSRVLDLETIDNPTTLEGVTISRMLARELGVGLGERIAMMVYDASIGRVRPVLLFIEGTYSTGYGEYDGTLIVLASDRHGLPLCHSVYDLVDHVLSQVCVQCRRWDHERVVDMLGLKAQLYVHAIHQSRLEACYLDLYIG